MKIEPVTCENIEQAAFVYKESWLESGVAVDDSECREYIVQRMPSMYLVFDCEPVGIFCLMGNEIAGLYIRSRFRRNGYGASCIEFAQERREYLKLIVMRTNDAAISLYERMGFAFSGEDSLIIVGNWEKKKI